MAFVRDGVQRGRKTRRRSHLKERRVGGPGHEIRVVTSDFVCRGAFDDRGFSGENSKRSVSKKGEERLYDVTRKIITFPYNRINKYIQLLISIF